MSRSTPQKLEESSMTPRLREIIDLIFENVEACGYIDLGPHTDLWSRNGLLQPEMPPPFRPACMRDRYKQASFWITFVGGRASIPVEAHDYAMVIRMLRQSDLAWAAQGGHLLIAQALIELGRDVSEADPAGDTPLHWAVFEKGSEMVELFLAHGADPNFPNRSGRTALHVAAMEGIMDLATLLLCAGADPAIADDQGETARDVALHAGHHDLAQLLGKLVSQQQASALRTLTGVASGALDSPSNAGGRRRL
jgi:hypothetical protein